MAQTCEEVRRRFDVFLDAESDGRAMREVALHVTRCRGCEEELRRYETLEDLVKSSIRAAVDSIDVSELWKRVEMRLEPTRVPWWMRVRDRIEPWLAPTLERPAIAGALAVAAIVITLALRSAPSPEPSPEVARNDAHIERLSSSASNVVVWREPEAQTTAIWVASYEP